MGQAKGDVDVKAQYQVREFMKIVMRLTLPSKPTLPTDAQRALCLRLIDEEKQELEQALLKKDLVEVADAVADLMYVTLDLANFCGLPMEEIFNEVHRSNMTKKDGYEREDGKWVKPANYIPPVLEPILTNAEELDNRLESGYY